LWIHGTNPEHPLAPPPSPRLTQPRVGRQFWSSRMSPSDPAAPRLAARLIESLAGLDLASADGRAGIRALLSEIERLAPGAILRQAATIELDRVGWRRAPVPSLEAPRAG